MPDAQTSIRAHGGPGLRLGQRGGGADHVTAHRLQPGHLRRREDAEGEAGHCRDACGHEGVELCAKSSHHWAGRSGTRPNSA